MARAQQSHRDVLFGDNLTIGSSDLAGLVRALLAFWPAADAWDWHDHGAFLPACKG